MAPLEHVVIVGATGTLGSAVLTALQTNSFNITALTRKDSIAVSVESGHVQCVDYDDPKSLVAALKGADAVVSAISSSAVPVQMKLIDASIEAGVKRFIPSEFGGDTFNEKSSQLPVYRGKIAVTEYLKQKASEGKIEYTAIMTGPFLDFGLAKGLFGFNIVEKKVTLFDGGSRPFSTTTLASVGQAVVGVLQHPAETLNTAVFVQSISVSQLELLKIYEDATNSKWQTVTVSTEEMEKKALGKISKGDFSGMRDLIARALFGEGYGCDFREKNSNVLLGVRELSKSDLSALIESVIKSQDAK